MKEIITDIIPEILNYTGTGRGPKNRKIDFKDMIYNEHMM